MGVEREAEAATKRVVRRTQERLRGPFAGLVLVPALAGGLTGALSVLPADAPIWARVLPGAGVAVAAAVVGLRGL